MKRVWSNITADRYFSTWIRARDKKCVFCGATDGLTCSHYFGRLISATRYDPDNCDALCFSCHRKHEPKKQSYYKRFKKKQLGPRKYKALEDRANKEETTRREEIIKLMKWLNS